MSVAEQLVAMGYPSGTAELAAGNNRNLDQALNYIQCDGVGFEPTDADVAEKDGSPQAEGSGFKCDECGKLLANDVEMQAHSSKTLHTRFSVTTEKVMSTDEKAAQVADIIKKNFEKIHNQPGPSTSSEPEIESRSNPMAGYREEAREREVKEAARLRLLQKKEDEVARKRIKEQIAQDREEKRSRAPAPHTSVVAPPPKSVDYSVANIQFRLLDGTVVKQEFKADEPLLMVRGWIEANHAKGAPFSMMTPYPRRIFSEEDMGTTLQKLDLVPSANLTLINRTV